MLNNNRIWIAIAVFAFVGSTTANAADCRGIKDIKKRLDCVEKRLDALPAVDLNGVVIEQAAHPGICLFFEDQGKPAQAVLGCVHPDEMKFNIHK